MVKESAIKIFVSCRYNSCGFPENFLNPEDKANFIIGKMPVPFGNDKFYLVCMKCLRPQKPINYCNYNGVPYWNPIPPNVKFTRGVEITISKIKPTVHNSTDFMKYFKECENMPEDKNGTKPKPNGPTTGSVSPANRPVISRSLSYKAPKQYNSATGQMFANQSFTSFSRDASSNQSVVNASEPRAQFRDAKEGKLGSSKRKPFQRQASTKKKTSSASIIPFLYTYKTQEEKDRLAKQQQQRQSVAKSKGNSFTSYSAQPLSAFSQFQQETEGAHKFSVPETAEKSQAQLYQEVWLALKSKKKENKPKSVGRGGGR